MKGTFGPLAFLLTGLAWLVLSALFGFALYIGLVRSTSLPASLFGPVDFRALLRLAAICLSLVMVVLLRLATTLPMAPLPRLVHDDLGRARTGRNGSVCPFRASHRSSDSSPAHR